MPSSCAGACKAAMWLSRARDASTGRRFMERRRAACEEVQARLRLRAASVEKDFWVCWTLRELFNLPEIGPRLTFKGGSSLSKAWKLIERFSEDIDVVIDRDSLGYGGDASPEAAPSRKKRRQILDALRASCQQHIRESLAPALSARIAQALGVQGWVLESDPADADGQTRSALTEPVDRPEA